MRTFKQYIFLPVLLLIISCTQADFPAAKKLMPQYPDMPILENPVAVLTGNYAGTAGMRMDASKPLLQYPGTFTVVPAGADSVTLSASIKPGVMPFPVNYALQAPSRLEHSSTGYSVKGNFKVDVTLGDGTQKDMPEFYFTLNKRSRICIDTEGNYWLELYYPDEKMANGVILPGDLFFRGKKIH